MINKNFILMAIAVFPVMLKAQSDYRVKGQVPTGHLASLAVMSYPPDDKGGEYRADTAAIRHGRFEFAGTIGRPQLAELNLINPNAEKKAIDADEPENSMKNVGLFYLDGDISVRFDESGKASYSGGGKEQQAWLDYEHMILSRQESQAEADFEFMQQLITDFVKSHPDNYVSVDLMDIFTQSAIQPEIVAPMYQALSKRMQHAEKVKGWLPALEKAKIALSGTQQAPSFSLNDIDGNPVSLKSYRGKYVLVDFWASWCAPCREENPNLLAAYERYKGNNFDVLAISLDTKKELWLKAIQEDKLPWKQVCDFKASSSEVAKKYEISSIPANVLVDPQGFIVGKDLRGEALHKRLADLLGK
ncbi:redoxin domain-containing protein [Sphingobacterium puteale]|uniref:redoxin domain-containing protein n=1 Tax=Sphingobacterium puteale TaxID=2420510 RepID=UPI003D97965C